jgi:hypothetical protein
MPIRDLLYACVECGREGGLKPTQEKPRAEVCERCSTRYTAAGSGLIRVERPRQPAEVKHPSEWLDLLKGLAGPPDHGHRDRVVVRIAERMRPYRHAGRYLGHIEEFGDAEEGSLTLHNDALVFTRGDSERRTWHLDDVTAIQPTSATLNLKIRRGPLVALRFPDASPLLWEERLRAAIQDRFTASGRGDILEFQPRIVCG